jgi:hypothetical protein
MKVLQRMTTYHQEALEFVAMRHLVVGNLVYRDIRDLHIHCEIPTKVSVIYVQTYHDISVQSDNYSSSRLFEVQWNHQKKKQDFKDQR